MNTESIIDFLDFRPGVIDVKNDLSNDSKIKSHFLKEIRENNFDVDYVYFSGDFPSVFFKKIKSFTESEVKNIAKIQRKIWNQGKVPMLYVESPTEVRIYNCYETPVNSIKDVETIENLLKIADFNKKKDNLSELSEVFDKVSIESGSFWDSKKYSQKITNEKRVNRALIENFKETRSKLQSAGIIDIKNIHDLLLRSLFLLYLEDRGATLPEFYNKYMDGAKSYFDILENQAATYKLFETLENQFHGDLSPVVKGEKEIINNGHLKIIKECFWSSINESSQIRLFDWRIFDFSIIPIELISEIYEVFLEESEGELKKSKDGAYYTPHALVEFILNKVLPYPSLNDSKFEIKLLDPTCGSGIFLVESLNRLLDRWEYANPNKQIDFSTIKKITKENIFGIEKNSEAIKVAAFSIYLTMLNRLNPRTLWESKEFPRLIYNENFKNKKSNGMNLFAMSSLGKGPFEDINFQLIVGNPPFKRGALNDEGKKYLSERKYAQEYVLAFLDRAISLCPNGKIALVAASKILFNTSGGYRKFREFLFQENYVHSIYNFSILRKVSKGSGGSLFASAVGPACVLFYSKTVNQENYEDKILYCAPRTYKSLLKNKIIDALVIEQSDIKYLPREECKNPDSKIWKVSMWGNERDFRFIKSLTVDKNLEGLFDELNWNNGVGFQTSSPLKFPDNEISKIPFVRADKIERYGTSVNNTESIVTKIFRRLGNKKAYKGPHVLIKEGQQNKKICASYLDYDCSFTSTIYGISGTKEDSNKLKLLTAYINSAVSTYYLFLTASSWGIERERIKPNEIVKLPNKMSLLIESSKSILPLINDRISISANQALDMEKNAKQLEIEIDKLLYSLFEFTEEEIILIEDCIQYNLDSFQEGNKSIAYLPVTSAEIELYGKYLSKEINSFLSKSSTIRSTVSCYEVPNSNSLNIISIHFNNPKDSKLSLEKKPNKLYSLLSSIDKYTYEKFSESVYFRKTLRYYKNDVIHIINPNEKRFWTRSMAYKEADEIIMEIINSSN